MNHRRIQNALSAYLDDELAPRMHKRVEAHLKSCEACADMLSAFRENRQQLATLVHPAPPMIKDAVMAEIRKRQAEARVAESSRATGLPDIGRWLPELGRWFFRPLTAGTTGVLTLALILGGLYLYPIAPQYEEAFDFYFGLHTEQLSEHPLKSNVGAPLSDTPTDSTDIADDAELFLDLYLGNVGD